MDKREKLKKLNLGCGKAKKEGYLNIDISPEHQPDLIHDLDIIPYPFDENEFDEIYLDHVIEHLEDPLAALEEIYRISKNNCRIILKCPHFSCTWLHPRHKSPISSYLFDFFDATHPEKYGEGSFRVEKLNLFWIRNRKKSLRNRSAFLKAVNFMINIVANLNIHITERVWCYWVGGFEEMRFVAKVTKVPRPAETTE